MRTFRIAFQLATALAATAAFAHGPQIQITNDNGKIVTRQLIQDGPYGDSLTSPKSVYVMPLLDFSGVWYSRPNNEQLAGLPAFPSGPGLAYGYDLADGGPQAFAGGSVISVGLLDGLKLWNGAAYADAGATELKAFRGSNANISTPEANFAITSDVGPFDSLSLAAIAENYGSEGDEVHGSFRWALLGDGSSPTSASPDGVYLLKLQASSTQDGLAPSDPYYFVLPKNATPEAVAAAVSSLGFAPELVQVVPEPAAALSLASVAMGISLLRNRSRG
jgi:hypothetical protein